MYTASVSGSNQILATNMAQQVIDCTRNMTYDHIYFLIHGQAPPTNAKGTLATATQTLSLYSYPADTSTSFFPRPLLRNESTNPPAAMTYNAASVRQRFPGTVTETLTETSRYDPNNFTGQTDVTVVVRWSDCRGAHNYTSKTTISQTGIHN
jgi:hypothetical protein